MKSLSGKTCLITGAGSGIGRELAFGLHKEGMRLFVSDIHARNLEATVARLRESGAEVHGAPCDVSQKLEQENLRGRFYEKYETLDLLINNAGIGGGGFAHELPETQWERLLAVNTWSIIYALQVFLPDMLEKNHGHFVSTGSGAGVVGIPFHIHYIASKFAVSGITEALHSEYKLRFPGVDFSVIVPTQIKTNIVDSADLTNLVKYLNGVTEDALEGWIKAFKKSYASRHAQGGVPLETAVSRYIQGIKKKRLYITDSPRLRLAMIIKGISGGLYKRVLQRQAMKDLTNIRNSLKEIGIEGDML
ncbi:SDR family NAD(P)-dependent oxidoreductase [Thermodesulfobacteriota bacterium]